MSKIGRIPISLSSASVVVDGNAVKIRGPKAEVVHELPSELKVELGDNVLKVVLCGDNNRRTNMLWGLHRALLANKICGVETGFEQIVRIVGLGYKAIPKGNVLTFSLGYSHTIDYTIPDGVTVAIDKSGQTLTFRSTDKFKLGNVCASIRALRPPEPYKGTGVMLDGERIIRKAGKAKS